MNKKSIFILIATFLVSGAIPAFSAEKEISVEDQFFFDMENEAAEQAQEIPSEILFAQSLQNELLDGNLDNAILLFDQLPADLSDNEDLKIILASLYISKGDYKKASSTANQILDKNSNSIEALELLALAARASGDKKKYDEISKKILAIDPYNASVNILQAEDLSLAKKYKPSREAYKKVLRNDPENQEALYGYAMTSYFLDDIKASKSTCEKILAKNPENVEALAFMGKLQAEQNNNKIACEYMEKALELGGPNYDYLLELGLYYKNRNLNSKSIEVWEKAIALQPSYFLGYAYLAGLYDEINDTKTALDYYRMVIKTNPEYYFAYEETAILEFHAGNWDRAIQYFSKAYEYSKSWSYQMMIAACQFKKKDVLGAKKTLAAVMKPLDRESLEYNVARFFNDSYSKNAETSINQKISKEDNSNKKGKMLFYMGLYYEINGFEELAKEYYAKVSSMQAPMFFEYRLAEWGMGL